MQTLRAVQRLTRRNGRAPDTAEVARELGMTRYRTSYLVRDLRLAGMLEPVAAPQRQPFKQQSRGARAVLSVEGLRVLERMDDSGGAV